MPEPTLFQLIDREFRNAGVRVVLVGGFALQQYGVVRMTVDVDFMLTEAEYPQALAILSRYGYQEIFRGSMFARLRSQTPLFWDVDFLFVEPATLEKVLAPGAVAHLDGAVFPLPTLEHLMAMKLHAVKFNAERRSAKDLPDIVALAQANQLDLRGSVMSALCHKFGSEAIHRQLLSLAGEGAHA